MDVFWSAFGAFAWLWLGVVVVGMAIAVVVWQRERRMGAFVVGTGVMFAVSALIYAVRT